MMKFLMVNKPDKIPKCECGGSIDWFGMFSVHDLKSDNANGYCTECKRFKSVPKEDVYGEIKELSIPDLKKLLAKDKK